MYRAVYNQSIIELQYKMSNELFCDFYHIIILDGNSDVVLCDSACEGEGPIDCTVVSWSCKNE